MGSTGAWLTRSLWLADLLLVLLIAFLGAAMVQSYRRLTQPVRGAFVPLPPARLPEPLHSGYQPPKEFCPPDLLHPPPPPPSPPPPSSPCGSTRADAPVAFELVGSVTSLQGHQYAIIGIYQTHALRGAVKVFLRLFRMPA